MPDDEARLEIVAVERRGLGLGRVRSVLAPAFDRRRFDEDEIGAELILRVARVKAREHPIVLVRGLGERIAAEDLDLRRVERRRGTRIAAARRPRVFGDDRARMLGERAVEDGGVEFAEAGSNGVVDFEVRRHRRLRIIRDVEALVSEDVDDQILMARRVEKPEPHGKREGLRVVVESER